MGEEWLEKIKSSIPRGFSRCYIIKILGEGPHTGKQIIDRASEESGGRWSPSPGLIYPLLGRLLNEGLIEETDSEKDSGGYRLTKKGAAMSGDMQRMEEQAKKQIDVLLRLGNIGMFAAADILERMASIGSMLGKDAGRMTSDEMDRYRRFLKNELERLDGRQESENDLMEKGHDNTNIKVE